MESMLTKSMWQMIQAKGHGGESPWHHQKFVTLFQNGISFTIFLYFS